MGPTEEEEKRGPIRRGEGENRKSRGRKKIRVNKTPRKQKQILRTNWQTYSSLTGHLNWISCASFPSPALEIEKRRTRKGRGWEEKDGNVRGKDAVEGKVLWSK